MKSSKRLRENRSLKKNTAVYIDGENIPAKKADKIIRIIRDEGGVVDYIKVYGRQNDDTTRMWTIVAGNTENMKDIRLYGPPAKNKVDNKIIKDAKKAAQKNRNVDIYYIVSSDHDYVPVITALREKGKRVVVIGEKKASKDLESPQTNSFRYRKSHYIICTIHINIINTDMND